MSETPLGEATRDGETVVLRYERRLMHSPGKVWRAITESAHLRHWFPADIIGERAAGADLTIVFWPESIEQAGDEIEAAGLSLDEASLPGRLLTWDPPRTFAFTWDTEELRFDLAEDDGITLLTLTVRADKPAPRGFASTATGYHLCLDALVAHVENHHVNLFDEKRTAALEKRYAATL
ncbi:SRPBCC domain-containing protein [Ruania halotolerans]|uniref:SRPBCC domain-containing protein n=1 Tax=Ruania halotolerans TaxID=2897773 RepID=UPI001E63BEF3|nr:SRPBCC domain-containing protein [Ruania halotolerans]UFU05351.1 SRPBCC domain-containing protein [Ruania halotolerans]